MYRLEVLDRTPSDRYNKSSKKQTERKFYMNIHKNKHGQAVAPKTHKFGKEVFVASTDTQIRWLGGAGIMIHSHNTNIMIDPVLKGFDLPLLIDMPILPEDVPELDAIFITHIDNDHFSRVTCKELQAVCGELHTPYYVGEVAREEGLSAVEHPIHDQFTVGEINVTLTPAKHNWQSESSKYSYRQWKEEEYCGYLFDTKDGSIWLPSDSKLLEEHLHMPEPDVILFDFADNEWHITLDGAITLANTYPNSHLICIHWGSVDAPTMSPFNGNPEDVANRIVNPERLHVLAAGEAFVLKQV